MGKRPDLPIGRSADRHETVTSFRDRLQEAMDQVGINQSGLARAIGVDRSTLSQLLSRSADRLPRADTVASMAMALQVSTDWLLGLAEEKGRQAAILQEDVEIARPDSTTDAETLLARWHAEAIGYKIRYVPSTLPDLLKTDAVVAHEFSAYRARSARDAKTASENRLALSRIPEMEMEIACSTQLLRGVALGEGIWRTMPEQMRRDQLDHMATLLSELYPRVRLFLFDARQYYSVPYTVFGPHRAAIFLGQLYFVFNTREHIRTLSTHFDNLVRAAAVQAHEVADRIRDLRAECATG
jgi:transcriptional regulator with XRE-family HTH domain